MVGGIDALAFSDRTICTPSRSSLQSMSPLGSSTGGPGCTRSPLPDSKLVSSALGGPQVDTPRRSDRPRLIRKGCNVPSLGSLPEARVTLIEGASPCLSRRCVNRWPGWLSKVWWCAILPNGWVGCSVIWGAQVTNRWVHREHYITCETNTHASLLTSLLTMCLMHSRIHASAL